VLDVFGATRLAADRARSGDGPTLLVADTFRMGGHATHDEAEARRTFDAELFEAWGRRDPIGLYEEYLIGEGIGRDRLDAIEAGIIAEVDAAAEEALNSRQTALPRGEAAEYEGFSAGVRQPGLAARAGGLPA
jgi:TPP-dependent pyruvate/acetoin dehydrogenase alpha subunit